MMQVAAAHVVDVGLEPIRDMLDEVVLVGGASIGFWLDHPAAPPARPTNDIDLVVMARTQVQYHLIADRLRSRGLNEDATSNVICRWRSGSGAIIDVTPIAESIFGSANQWYADAFAEAEPKTLPSGAVLRVATPPYVIATKFEAFDDPHRADGGDYMVSADMHDVIALVDGRIQFEDDFEGAAGPVRGAVTTRLRNVTAGQVELALLNYLPPDATAPQRAERIRGRIAYPAR